ncbi:pilus assembly FimT family protein [Rubinisphaera margarita]|uniref:pilus assembly FimT family protein n=1 Tax=Rubinisphaera margarita TaxID=2909586 RepID=UPI001EE789F7|nr:prepilin-type N-terminal cleavage/methylation domain-containing protein [Rubinisphaera margarita]MCG6154853.1 prepilin-type N-terminal cleavage/methylation domain-containing protein [Rubinisphaera margarita]
MQSRRSSNRLGFTLVELLLTIVLLSVLIAVSVPSLNSLTAEQQLLSVSGDVEQFLNNQRRDAVRDGQRRWVRFSSGDHVLIAGLADAPATSSLTLPESLSFMQADWAEDLPSELLGELGLNSQEHRWSAEVLFNTDGTSTGANFYFEDDRDTAFQITVHSLNGHVAVTRAKASDLEDRL